MATETYVQPAQRRDEMATGAAVLGVRDVFWSALRPWVSLKLTVLLFALAIILILVGTLAQVTRDMWEVISLYFRAWICWIEAPVFFPRSWFPDLSEATMRTIVALLLLTGALAGGIPCFARRGRSWLWPLAAALLAALGLALAVQTVTTGGFWFLSARPTTW